MSTPQDYMNRLFAQAQGSAASSEVAQAGRAAGLGAVTGYGTESMASELEVDARTMSAAQLAQKYGHETAMGLLGSKAVAAQQYQNLRDVNTRSGFEVVDDTVQGVADGFINSVLGIVGLATGAVSDAGGAAIAEAAEDYNEWSGGFRSDQMQSRSLARELRNEMRQRDNDAAYEADKKADGDGLMTGLRRIGREALSGGAAMFDDGTTFGEDVSQAVGSLAAAGPISKGVKFAGQALKGGAKLVAPKTAERVSNAVFAARGAGVPATRAQAIFNTALGKAEQAAPMMAAITAMEAGGTYNETVQDVMSMDFASLVQNSPVYNELIKQGMTPEDARMEIANVAGLTAAGKTAMIAAPLSSLVARFEGNVFSRRAINEARQNIGKPVGNMLGESAEEGGMGLGSGLAQNDAIQQYADRTRSTTENVGEQVGQGIVLGAASAGVAQSTRIPGSVADTALKTVGTVGSTIKGASSRLGAEAQAQAVSQQVGKTQESVAAAEASVAQASPEVRAKWDAAKAVYDVPKGAFQEEGVDPYIASVVGDVSNLPEAFSKLTTAVKEGKASPEQTEALEDMINFLSNDMESAVASAGLEPTGDAAIDAAISSMAETMNVVKDDEVIARARTNSISRAQKRIADVSATTEQKAAAVETLIASDPLSIPAEEAKVQLQHAESSTSNMSPSSKAALEASLTMIEEDAARREALEKDGYTPTNNDKVSNQVRNSTEWGNGTAQSLSGHIGRIFNFAAHGSKAAAAEQADHLRNFAQNMINKVEALNTHYKDWSKAEPVGYQQYTREGVWRTVSGGKKTGLSVIPVRGNSLQNARAIESDAQMAVNTVNAMADAFPELGLKKLAMPYLDQGLQGSKEDVIARHKQATGPAPIKRGQKSEAAEDSLPWEVPESGSKTSESDGANKAEPKKEQSPAEQLIDSASKKEQEAKDQMVAEKRARFEKEKAEARARKEKEAEAKKAQEEADAAAFQKELEAARAILEDKNAEGAFDFAKTEPVSQEELDQVLAMSDEEYIDAVTSDNADTSAEVSDALVNELKDAELPKGAKKIKSENGIDLYALGNFLYALKGDKVVGQLAVTEGGTEFAVTEKGQGIGKMLMRELLIRDPLHASGGLSPAAKATRLSVLKDLRAEQKPVETGGFQLTDGQVKALAKAREFVADAKQVAFSIIGAAGTGKTTIVSQLLSELPENKAVILSSPTHRANAVTASKGNTDYPIMTLHSLLGLKPSMQLEKFDASKPQFDYGKQPDIPSGAIIVMDESSMIPDKLYKFLLQEVKAAKAKIIFLGDSAQLAPIGQESLSLALTDPNHGKAELTEVKRAKNSALLGESVRVRKTGKFSNEQSMKGRDGVSFTTEVRSFLAQAVKMFKSDSFQKNPLLARVLAFTNNQVRNYNSAIRAELFPDQLEVVKGDLMMGYNTIGKDEDGDATVSNGVDYIVEDVGKTQPISIFGGVKLPGYSVTLRNVYNGQTSNVVMISPNTPKSELDKLSAVLGPIANNAWKSNSTEAKIMDSLRESFVFPFDVPYYNTKFDSTSVAVPKTIDFGYAHTIHKSQGGTYTYALVDGVDINVARSEDDRARLRYVGLTRAERGTYVLTNGTISDSRDQGTTAQTSDMAEEVQTAVKEPTIAEVTTTTEVDPVEAHPMDASPNPETWGKDYNESETTPVGRTGLKEDKNLAARFKRFMKGSWFNYIFQSKTEESRIAGNSITQLAELFLHPELSKEIPAVGDVSEDILTAYRDMVSTTGKEIVDILHEHMDTFLSRKYSQKKGDERTNLDVVRSSEMFFHTASGRLTHLLEETPAGLRLNEEAVAAAALAGLQWYLNAGSSNPMSAEEWGDALGMPVTDAEANRLNAGVSYEDAVSEIAQRIERYLDIRSVEDAPTGMTQGIFNALAQEVLEALTYEGVEGVTIQNLKISGVEATSDLSVSEEDESKYTNIRRITVHKEAMPEALKADSNVIERIYAKEPAAGRFFFGDQTPKARNTRHNQPRVLNTPEQVAVLETMIQQVYGLNMPMLRMLQGLDNDAATIMFAEGKLNPEKLNKFDYESRKSRNNNVINALETMKSMVSEMTNALSEGQTLADLAIRYDWNFTSVTRAMMLGDSNPQANKVMRALVLPTWSTIDTTSDEGSVAWTLAMGQGLGIGIHKQSLEATETQLRDLLGGPLKEALATLRAWDKSKTDNLDVAAATKLRKQLTDAGVSDPAWGLFALMEQARLENATAAERKSFKTPLYLEADGVTNGPIMGIGMLTTKWTAQTLRNLQKGGIAIGRKDMTLADMRAEDKVDLYGESGAAFPTKFAENIKGEKKEITEAANNLLKLMSNFLGPKFLKLTTDANGNTVIEVDRGLAKSPLTITLYGSGAAGIAGNFVDQIMEVFHGRISEVMSKLPEEATAEDEAAALEEVFGAETQELVDFFSENYFGYSKENGSFYISKNADGSKFPGRKGKAYSKRDRDSGKTLKDMTFSRVAYENMKSAMLNLFVNPLIESINDTVGSDVMMGMKMIQKITSTQSVLAVQMFQDELANMLEAKKAADPTFRPADFLSNRELDQLFAKLSKAFPAIEVGGHTFDLMGRMKSFLKKVNVSDILNGNRVMAAKTYGPKVLGVGGIPSMIIGSGDASMILGAYLTGKMKDTMSVYDGVHLSLANIQSQSEVLNEQAFNAAMNNPVDAVVKSLAASLKTADVDALLGSLIDDSMADVGITSSLQGFNNSTIGKLSRTLELDSDTVLEMLASGKRTNLIKGFRATIQKAMAVADLQSELIEASHQAVGSIGAAVDHMASGFSPKTIEGNQEGNFDGKSHEALADELEGRTLSFILANGTPDAQAIAQARSLGKKNIAVQNLPALAPTPVGNTTKSGAVVMSFEHLLERSRASDLTPVQREMLREALRSGALRDWTFVTGTPEQLSAYSAAATEALSSKANSTVHGAVDLATKTVFLPATENETLIHEATHAATVQILLDALTGKKVPSHVKQAVKNLETLLEDFMAIRVEQMPAAAQVSYMDAKAEAMKYLSQNTPTSKALAINEMMAWVLGNKSLADALKQKQAPSKVVEFTKRLFDAVKRMFWGSATVSAPANDFLSNLMFNTKVLMNTVPDSTGTDGDQQGGNISLKHQTSRKSTLSELADNLENRLRAFIAEGIDITNLGITPNSQQMQAAKAASQKLVELDFAGFKMTPDERRTANVLMTVLGTSMSVDPNVMNTAHRVYDAAMKTLSPDSFREVGVDRDQASEMYDAVSGKQSQGRDALGRSLLLPAFLALAFTNPVMQQVLSNISTPSRTKKEGQTFNEMLERLGDLSMDFLDRKLSGQTGKEQNLQQVMDRLFAHVHLAAMNNEGWFTSASKAGQAWVDKGNDLILKGFEVADTKLKTVIAGLSNSNTRMDKNIKNALTLLRGGLTDEGADRVAQGATSLINQKGVFQWVRDLSNDLIGRTDANASLYDMIKVVRTKVQQMRQLYREEVPTLFHKKFKAAPTAAQYSAMHKALGSTEVASLLGSMKLAEVLDVLRDGKKLDAKIAAIEANLTNKAVRFKANQLAEFLVTGDPGVGLQRNAYAIAKLTGKNPNPVNVREIDAYVTLLALKKISPDVMKEVRTLLVEDSDAVGFMLSYNKEQLDIDTERAKQSEVALLNRYKGQLPVSLVPGQKLVVRPVSEHGKLMSLGYTKVADYEGSAAERVKEPRAYYFSPVDGQAVFNQGLLQNTQQSVGGVQLHTGFSMNSAIAGRITNKKTVDRITNDITFNGDKGRETLMPIFGEEGQVIAYERSIRQDMKKRVVEEYHYGKALGMWRGRQVEELAGDTFNRNLIKDLKARQDRAKPGELATQFINLRSNEAYNDPILRDAALLLTKDVEAMFDEEFGEDQPIYVERSMVKDVLGYRAATVGDMWTGTTRLSPATTEVIKDLLVTVLGKDAYTKAIQSERFLQGVVTDARVLIAVKSVVVPAVNMLANLLHLISRGVPLHTIRRMPEKLNELNQYVKMESERIAAETELTAAKAGTLEHRRLTNRLQAIQDAQHRLSIWPLIEAGEFSTVAEVGLTHEDLMLTRGRLSDYIEKQIDKLPSEVATVGHNLLLSKHTALFRGLQKSVQYGDFLAKAVMYDHLLTQKGQTKQKALSVITEEFVNYDRLPGRTRGYLESVGLMWFYNFKLRSVKVAFSTIRNNPLHTLLAFMIPEPDIFGNAGLPVEDNALSKLMGGSLWGSLGPAQGMRAIGLNPWFNAIN